jgi:hypothetical protein
MAQRSKKGSLLASLSSLPTDNASAEAAWRQALLLRELSRDERVVARKRRAEAEAAKEYAENEAITATKQLCSELQSQARMKLQEAEDTLADAQRVKTNAEAYSEEIQGTRVAAEALMSRTRAGADEMASRMRIETAEDIRKILTEVEIARASAEDELETQRILTETARVRAFSHGLAVENAADELSKTNAPKTEASVQQFAAPKRTAPKKKASVRKATKAHKTIAKRKPIRKVKAASLRKAA